MELEQFIEQDIRSFLDNQLKVQASTQKTVTPPARKAGVLAPEELALYAPTRDYAKELDAALDKHDLVSAKQLLREFKTLYDSYPEDAPERLEAKRLFKSLYTTFQQALLTEEASQEAILAGEAKQFPPPKPPAIVREAAPLDSPFPTGKPPAQEEQAQQESTAEEKPATPTEDPFALPQKSIDEPPPQLHDTAGMSDAEERALAADLDQIATLLAEEKYAPAITAYKETRHHLTTDNLSPEQRNRYIPRLQQLYQEIHQKLMEKNPTKETALLDTFTSIEEQITHSLSKETLPEAMHQYHELRDRYQQLPPALKKQVEMRMLKLYRQINTLRNTGTAPLANFSPEVLDAHEQKLQGVP